MQLTLHAIHRRPHGTCRRIKIKKNMSAWSVKTRRAPSRHCRDARVYGQTTTAKQRHDYTAPCTRSKYVYPGRANPDILAATAEKQNTAVQPVSHMTDIHHSPHRSTHLTMVTAGPALPPLRSLPTTRHLSGTPVSPSPAPGTPLRIASHVEREGGKGREGKRCGT